MGDMTEGAGDGITYEELLRRAQAGEMGLPVTVDPVTGEMIIDIDAQDDESMGTLRALLGEAGIELPDGVADGGFRDMVDRGWRAPLEVGIDESDADALEFDITCYMTSSLDDEAILDHAAELVAGGLVSLSGNGDGTGKPVALRPEWEGDWEGADEEGGAVRRARYLLGGMPPGDLRALIEESFKRATLQLVAEGGNLLNDLMAQAAARLVAAVPDGEGE